MENKLLSVIVPIYNVEKTMNRCIQSIVEQTYKNLEIILVNDGSPDSCPYLCEIWKKKDNRISVIHKKNGGLSSARNAGLDCATGEYIAFIDSDDFLEIEAFEKMIFSMEKDNSDMVICNFWCYMEQRGIKQVAYELNNMCYNDIISLMLMEYIPTSAWCKVIKRTIMFSGEGILFEEGRQYEDTIPSFKQALLAKKVSVVSEPLYYYVENENSIVAKPRVKDIQDLISNTEQLRILLQGKVKSSLIETYICSTLTYALQLWYRLEVKEEREKRKILLKIKESKKKIDISTIIKSRKWKKIIFCKLSLIDIVIRFREYVKNYRT